MNHHGHFGPSLELDPGSTKQLAVSDTRRGGPPVSDTRSKQRSAAADTERVKRPVSDTSLLDQGASVSDTRTMATASDDDITIYIASAGVQNAEQAAGMPEPWTLPGSNNSRYYDEPQYSQRCETVRTIAQGDRAELVDCRGLRDPHVDNSLHRHLGTHYVNAAANVNQRGFADVLEDLCQAISALFAWAMTQSQTGIYLVLCFLCNSGRHRSVLMAGLLEHFLISRGLHARARHLCSGAWGHMCHRNPPCQACDADWRTARWVNTYQYFEDQFLRLCYKHKFHHSEWWTYFKMPNFPPGGPPGHAMLPPVVPRLEEDARPPRARPATPPPPKTGGITLVDAASRARSQGAPQTARVLEARQQHQTAEHRAQSRVRFDEAMAGIGVQNVRHADADAGTAPRGQGTTAKAKAANFAAAHRATVAAAAQRTAQAADPAQGGQASTARGSADPAPEATPQRGRRRRASRPPEETAASSAAAAADSSPGAPLNTNAPWDLGADITREDLEWVAEHMPDMAPRFDDYEFWSIHEAVMDEAQSRDADLRDQGVYEPEDLDSAFPRGRKGRKGKGKSKGKGRSKGKSKSRSPPRRRSRSRSQGPDDQHEDSEEEEQEEDESETPAVDRRVFRTPSRPGRWRPKRQARSRSRALGRRRQRAMQEAGRAPPRADLTDIIREHGEDEARRRHREMGETGPRVHGGPARLHQPRADIPDDAIEMQTPGVGSRGERLRLMRGAAIPVLPEPDPAPGIPHWDTMSDLELLRRALGEDRHAPGAQIMEALRVRIEQKKKNLAFTWKNSYLPREVAIRIDVKVTPNDSQVFLDDQLRAAEQRKTTWGLHPRGEGWRWIRDEVRVDVEHVTWWDAPARPVLAVIINRPWACCRGPGPSLYKVAQHACSNHVQGQAFTSQGKSHLMHV